MPSFQNLKAPFARFGIISAVQLDVTNGHSQQDTWPLPPFVMMFVAMQKG